MDPILYWKNCNTSRHKSTISSNLQAFRIGKKHTHTHTHTRLPGSVTMRSNPFLTKVPMKIWLLNQKLGGFYPPKWMVKIMENPIKMDDLGVPLFLETPKYKTVRSVNKKPWPFHPRSLEVTNNHWKGSPNHPKKVTKNCQVIIVYSIFLDSLPKDSSIHPPLKTNISPKNQWLEDDSCPFKMVSFFGGHVNFLEGLIAMLCFISSKYMWVFPKIMVSPNHPL